MTETEQNDGSAEDFANSVNTNKGVFIPLSFIAVQDGFNVREDVTPDEEFLNSIKAHQVLRPLHVRDDPNKPGHYLIVDGERRYRAAIAAGLESVPVIPEGAMEDSAALVLSLVANEGSKPLTAQEEAQAFKRLKDSGVSIEDIAEVMGRSTRKVEETLRALESGSETLAKGVMTDDPEEKIPPRAAARAASLPADKKEAVASKIKGKNVNEGLKIVREAEKEIGSVKRGRKATDYPWAKDAKSRAEILEKAAKQILAGGTNRRADAHLEVIHCLKGKFEPGELYESLLAKEEAAKPKSAAAKKGPKVKKVAVKKAAVKAKGKPGPKPKVAAVKKSAKATKKVAVKVKRAYKKKAKATEEESAAA